MADADNLPVRFVGGVVRAEQPDWDSFGSGPSQRSAQHALRDRLILEMRAHGYSYDQIREKLIQDSYAPESITTRQVEGMAERAIKNVRRDPAEEVRKIELKRLDMMMQVFFAQALQGHGPSCDRVVAMMERRARIEGIDAPLDFDFSQARQQFFGLLSAALSTLDMKQITSSDSPDRAILGHVLQAFADASPR